MSNQVTERPGQKRQPTRRAAPQRTARKSAPQRTARKSTPQRTVRNRPKQATRRSRKKPTRRRVALGKIFGRTFVRRLVTSVAVAVFIGLVLMAFLRVRNISVVGNSMYSREEIQEASGISEGSALLLVNKTTAASRIRAQLPYIDEVRVGIGLPDTVKIEVVELETTFAVAADDGSFWLINSGGRLIERITGKDAGDYLKIEGVRIESGETGDQAKAVEEPEAPAPEKEENEEEEETEEETEEEEAEERPPEASAAERLDAALQIVRQLAEEDDIRSITSVDVSSIYDLQIWYGTRFQVKLGGTSELSYKLEYMVAALAQLDSYQSGVLDLTFQEAKKATFIPWSS